MYFPLIERRISSEDRRVGGLDRRRKRRSAAGENALNSNSNRRTGKERRVLQLDRETLLYGALLGKDAQPKPEEKKSKSMTICSLILIPLTIAVTSALVTHFINEKQLESAKIIASQQNESAKVIAAGQRENAIKIANANIENSKTIASAQMETQHLEHMVSIFSSIISPQAGEEEDVIYQRIRSLAVYGDEALPFLLQIRRYSLNKDDSSGNLTLNVTTETINRIVKDSQLDLSKQIVRGESEDSPVNLRRKKYVNYNLNGSLFEFVNLYQADFSGSSLQGSKFIGTDLQESIFQGANLKGVIFEKANLRKTDFRNAYLQGVQFNECAYIETVKFSLFALLRADQEPVKSISLRHYTLLLMNYEEQLAALDKEERGKLTKALDKLNMTGFDELQTKFNAYRVKGIAGTTKKQEVRLSMNP